MTSPSPLHSDRSQSAFSSWVNPVLAGFLLVAGVVGSDPSIILLGAILGLFVWFTRHFRYDIFPDRLVIHYGMPRQKSLPLAEIEGVQLLKLPWGGLGLLVKKKRSWGLVLRPTDPERFATQLEQARRGPAG